MFEKNGASKFWRYFDAYDNVATLEMNDSVRILGTLAHYIHFVVYLYIIY